MAQKQLRSFLSLIALIFLMIGTGITMYGLIEIGNDPSAQYLMDEQFIVPGAVGNTLCVIFLVWITMLLPNRSNGYKFLIISILILGLIAEIYLTFFFPKPPAVYGTYVLVVLNFLIRTFYVLDYVQDSWDFLDEVPTLSKPSAPVSKPVEQRSEPEKKAELTDQQREAKRDAREKLDASIKTLKEDPRGYMGPSIQQADQEIGKQIRAGKSAYEAFRAAKDLLKYKDGTPYTGAGRRRA